MKQLRFAGHDCLAFESDVYRVIVAVSVGPRILCFQRRDDQREDGPNVLAESSDVSVQTSCGTWRAYGGHRLWVAPEGMPLSYAPDNEPVLVEQPTPGGVVVTRVDRDTLIDRTMSLRWEDDALVVEHRLTNRGPTPRSLSAWALTILNPGGTVYVPQEPYATHAEDFSPARPMVLWRYTDLGDRRFGFSQRFVTVTPDPNVPAPNKLGFGNRRGVVLYERDGQVFSKRFVDEPMATYPDFGSNTEIFTAGSFIEMETLGPLETVAQHAATLHTERWQIHNATVAETLSALERSR